MRKIERVKVVSLLILVLTITTISIIMITTTIKSSNTLNASTNYSKKLFNSLKEGILIKYRLPPLNVTYNVGGITWKFISHSADTRKVIINLLNGKSIRMTLIDAYFEIKVAKLLNDKALLHLNLTIVGNKEVFTRTGFVYVNLKTREVYLLNGTKVGVTCFWLPSSLSNFRLGEFLNLKTPYYIISGEYGYVDRFGKLREVYVVKPVYKEAYIIITVDDILRNNTSKGIRLIKIYEIYNEKLRKNVKIAEVQLLDSGWIVKVPLNFKVWARLKKGYYVPGTSVYDKQYKITVDLPFIDPLYIALGIRSIDHPGLQLYEITIPNT